MKFEDVDFSLRMKQETDYKLVVLPDPLAIHSGVNVSLVSFANFYYRSRNLILLQRRFAKSVLIYTLLIYFSFKFFRTLLSCFVCLIKGKKEDFQGNLKGLGGMLKGEWDGLWGKFGPLK